MGPVPRHAAVCAQFPARVGLRSLCWVGGCSPPVVAEQDDSGVRHAPCALWQLCDPPSPGCSRIVDLLRQPCCICAGMASNRRLLDAARLCGAPASTLLGLALLNGLVQPAQVQVCLLAALRTVSQGLHTRCLLPVSATYLCGDARHLNVRAYLSKAGGEAGPCCDAGTDCFRESHTPGAWHRSGSQLPGTGRC